MPDSADQARHSSSPELAELVQRTLAAKRSQHQAEQMTPSPSWSVSVRFRIGGFRRRPGRR